MKDARIVGPLDLIPMQRREFDLPVSCNEFLERIRSIVRADSLLFANYWQHKGNFVGNVTEDGFRIKRFIRQIWVPLVLGRVRRDGEHCRLSLCFFAPESIAFLLGIGLFSVILFKEVGFGGLAPPFLFTIIHVLGCFRFKQEVETFLRAAGISTNGDDDMGDALETEVI
jgi:hypothetical protein